MTRSAPTQTNTSPGRINMRVTSVVAVAKVVGLGEPQPAASGVHVGRADAARSASAPVGWCRAQ